MNKPDRTLGLYSARTGHSDQRCDLQLVKFCADAITAWVKLASTAQFTQAWRLASIAVVQMHVEELASQLCKTIV